MIDEMSAEQGANWSNMKWTGMIHAAARPVDWNEVTEWMKSNEIWLNENSTECNEWLVPEKRNVMTNERATMNETGAVRSNERSEINESTVRGKSKRAPLVGFARAASDFNSI